MSKLLNQFIHKEIKSLEQEGLKRELRETKGAQGAHMVIEGHHMLNFCSNDYLGLANDQRLVKTAQNILKQEGLGSGASRLVCGHLSSHRQLEHRIAQFKHTESCLLFSTGYMANVGIISSLFGRDDVIFSDRLNHASIIDGIQLSKAKMKRYAHCDMESLERMLKETKSANKKVIITDSVFSMDGDIAPLDDIVRLAKKYHCLVMIDEAHALGVIGKTGRGLAEHFNVEADIDIVMGTLSKAVGAFGAYCCGSSELITFLINKARSFIYTTGMPPSIAAAAEKGIDIIEKDKKLREQLWENTYYTNVELKSLGFDTMYSQTPIIPILVKDANVALTFSKKLFEKGIFISAIRPPTVPKNMARLRLTVTAKHTREDLDRLLDCFTEVGKELGLI